MPLVNMVPRIHLSGVRNTLIQPFFRFQHTRRSYDLLFSAIEREGSMFDSGLCELSETFGGNTVYPFIGLKQLCIDGTGCFEPPLLRVLDWDKPQSAADHSTTFGLDDVLYTSTIDQEFFG
jgi:hypothetical protein